MTTPVEEVLTKGDEAQELWMPVEEFNGRYEVSNQGRVRSLQKGEPALMKLGKQRDIVVTWMRDSGTTHCRRVDRLVLEAFIGPAPGPRFGPSHQDDDMSNCRLDNLHWEDGLARGPYKKSARRKPGRKKGSVNKKPTSPKRVVPQQDSVVREHYMLDCGNISVVVNDGRVDLSQIDLSQETGTTSIISLKDVGDMIKILQQIQKKNL